MLKGSILALAIFALTFAIAPALLAEANAKTAQAKVDWGSVFLTLDPDKAVTDAAVEAAEGELDPEEELTPAQRHSIINTELAKTGHGDINFGMTLD